jgi:hypothetical protein
MLGTDTFLGGILIIAMSVLLALLGLVLAHRLVPTPLRESNTTVAGLIYMPFSGLVGVVTAFTIVFAWQNFDATYKTTQREAAALADVYWHADDFSDLDRQEVQQLAQSYAQVVIDEEWPLMAQGGESTRAWEIVDEIRRRLDEVEPTTNAEQVMYGREVTQFDAMVNERRLRLLESSQGLPLTLWAALLINAPLLIIFTYLFPVKNFLVHMVMVAALTLVVTSMIFTIRSLEYPFSGDLTVKPTSIELVLNGFKTNSGP